MEMPKEAIVLEHKHIVTDEKPADVLVLNPTETERTGIINKVTDRDYEERNFIY
jgi:hypothetical protein